MDRIVIKFTHVFCLLMGMAGAASAQLSDSTQRVVRMQGTVNFRDVGGYRTNDGKKVVWGKIFRSADVSHLTDQDLTVLEQKHIHTVIDFRGVKEAAAAPDHLLPQTDYLLCPAGSDSLPSAAQMGEVIKSGQFLEKFYSNTDYLGARYKPLFQKLLTLPDNESMMYHCTGGRDRTGMATALFLYALGVPQQTIEADFTASNVYLMPMNQRMFKGMEQSTGLDTETIRKALELKPELLQTLFNAIKGKYGSVDNFFEKELGIGEKERAILKQKYTI
ncbi:tyrosine-protein phosphatase [Chitinophaga arvensicola]|uniref:Protein-tyrosine phosphatase n=1 Tax=Chitinophaga arvensicola TaxID=29529 RepID=A0A1I0SBS2_9BACT|nr:tyrosine-protein phosphatase [Chitinophaga arvensicola]SEW54070.1 protein-tyrosine phosphatase [Chitinophaga arvensicola]